MLPGCCAAVPMTIHARAEGAHLCSLVADTVDLASDYPLDPTVRSILASQTDEEKAIRYRYRAGEMRALATLPGAEKLRDALIVIAEHYGTTPCAITEQNGALSIESPFTRPES
jgi:hypothetical protein